jgi:hypothetical protein
MKLKDKGSLVVYNVPQEVGQKLVASGLALEVVSAEKPPASVRMFWAVRDGAKVGDFLYPCGIFAKCSHCGVQSYQESTKGTAHETMKFRHAAGCASVTVPGIPEPVPAHIAEAYKTRWAKYISLSRNKKVVLPALTKNTSVPGSGTRVQTISVQWEAPKG